HPAPREPSLRRWRDRRGNLRLDSGSSRLRFLFCLLHPGSTRGPARSDQSPRFPMNTLLQDLRYGLRTLLKNKSFTAIAVLALALGVGANTAIFSLVNGVLLRPLPFPNAERIVYFEGKNPTQGITESNISLPDYMDWSQQTDLFANTAVFYTANSNLAADGAEPERVPRAGVTPGFFNVLGVQPILGRTFIAEDDQPDTQTVAIISDG